MNDSNPTKRIPKSLGTDAKLVGSYTLSDLAVGLLPGVVVVLVFQILLPSDVNLAGVDVQTLTLPFAGAGILVGALFVYLTPSYTTSVDWLETFVGFHAGSNEHDHDAAKRYTHLERVHPDHGALERTDGSFLGLVSVQPPSMALATDAEWTTKTEAFRDFCNTVVQFPIQIYSTTQPFPVEEYLARYEDRLDDPDVKANPRLRALIENYIEWYERDLSERKMTIRDHYVVVSVSPESVQFERASLIRKLAVVPVLGVLVRSRYAPRREDQREAMFDELHDRLRQVTTGLREIDGCSASIVDPDDATVLLGRFWSGEDREYGDMDAILRTTPIVGGPE